MTLPRKRPPTPRFRYADEKDLIGPPVRDLRLLDKAIATLDDYEHLVALDGCCGVCGGTEPPEDRLESQIQESWERDGLVC